MSYTALFDRGSSNTFFDPNIFDTSFHYTVTLAESAITTSDSVVYGNIIRGRTIQEGLYTMFDPGFGGPMFDPNIFDTSTHRTLAVSDLLAEQSSFFRTIAESISASDAVSKSYIANRMLSEPSISVIDSLSKQSSFFRTILEGAYVMFDAGFGLFDSNIFDTTTHTTLVPVDVLTRNASLFRSLTESISESEVLSEVANRPVSISEPPIPITDSVSTQSFFFRTLSEAQTVVTDAVARVGEFIRTLPESAIAVSDSIAAHTVFSRILAEIIIVSDSLIGVLPTLRLALISRIKRTQSLISRIKRTLSLSVE